MAELINISKEIYNSAKRLEEGSKKIFTLAKNKAEKEQQYRKALAIKIFELRESKYPATLIGDLARGETSEFKFQRDLADAEYTAGRDALESIRSQMTGLQSILKYQNEL